MHKNAIFEWTRPKLVRFQADYAAAAAAGKDTFVFEGSEFVVGYAKYLIEYLNGVLA